MHRLIKPIMLLVLGLGLATAAVELPAAPKGKDTPVPAAKPETDKGVKDPADFFRPPGLVRTSYSQAAGKQHDEEIATYHASAGMDEVAAAFLERLQAAGWKKGSDTVSGADIHRLRMIEWTMPGKEAELRFYAVKDSGSDLRVRIFTYKTVTKPGSAAAGTATAAQANAGNTAAPTKVADETPPPLSTVVTTPNIVGRTVADASSLLEEAGLKAQTNPEKTMRNVQTPGTVVEQTPLPGQKVKRGSTVTLVPWSSLIEVSDVMGSPLSTAQTILAAHRLQPQVGPAKQDLVAVGAQAKDGLVAEQSPVAGSAVALDSTVTLIPWVSQVIVPDLSGQTLAQAAGLLGPRHLKYQVLSLKPDQVALGASPKDGLIAVQNPAAGQTVALDSIITLIPWISKVRVPDLLDQPLAQAESQLTALQLKYEIGPVKLESAGSIPKGSAPKDGLVGAQSARPGVWLNLGATVTLNPWASQVPVPDVTGQELDQAQNLLIAQHFQPQVGPAKPDAGARGPSLKVGLVAEQNPAAGQAALWGSTVTLMPWGTAVEVDNLIKMPLGEAEKILTLHGLQYQVAPEKIIPVGNSVYTDRSVAEQDPRHGQIVVLGSTVTLTPWVVRLPVPDVTGQTLDQAQNLLIAQHFQSQVGPAKPDAGAQGPSSKAGLVAEQNPAAGQAAPRGSTVTLTPWASALRLDNFINQTLVQAQNFLTQRGLKYQVAPGKLIPAGRPMSEDGHIAEQNPAHGQMMTLGSTVILTPWVAPVIVPDLRNWPLGQAKSALVGLGLQFELGETVPAQDSDRETLVGLQSPAAGQGVTPGSTVTLRAYHYQGPQ